MRSSAESSYIKTQALADQIKRVVFVWYLRISVIGDVMFLKQWKFVRYQKYIKREVREIMVV